MIDIYKKGIFMHPISLNYLREGDRITGLRLTGVKLNSGIIDVLHSWKSSIGGQQGYTYPSDVLLNFSVKSYCHLIFLDLRVKDLDACLYHLGINLSSLYPFSPSIRCNEMGELTPEKIVCNNIDLEIFQIHLYLLLPLLASSNVRELGHGLYVDNYNLASKILFYNNKPICYLSKKEYALLAKSGEWSLNSNILECRVIKPRKLLCEGRGRHIPVNQGVSLMINISNGLVTKYTGALSGSQFISVNKVFDIGVFQWSATQRNKITGICGTK